MKIIRLNELQFKNYSNMHNMQNLCQTIEYSHIEENRTKEKELLESKHTQALQAMNSGVERAIGSSLNFLDEKTRSKNRRGASPPVSRHTNIRPPQEARSSVICAALIYRTR